MTQQQMASMTGTVREMIGRALRTLQKAGAIEARRGRISIKDKAKLQKFL
jgi:CRP/FNR family transcriptional regulator, cyclic AMP receptor protein